MKSANNKLAKKYVKLPSGLLNAIEQDNLDNSFYMQKDREMEKKVIESIVKNFNIY